jgi:hypothetical protein
LSISSITDNKMKLTKKKIEKFRKEGQYPRKTRNWLRYRQEEPGKFSQFRVKKISKDRELVIGKLKKTGKWEVQSVMKRRKK